MSEKITPPRVVRIQNILAEDPELKSLVRGEANYEMEARGGKKVLVHSAAVGVCQMLHEKGVDGYSAPKADVLATARDWATKNEEPIDSDGEVEVVETPPVEDTQVAAPSGDGDPYVKFKTDCRISGLSLLLSAAQILEHDHSPVGPARVKKITDIINQISTELNG